MSRRIDLPDHDRVRQAMNETIAAARDEGRAPTVIALAKRLGMNNTSFWRHFPDVARDLVATARATEPAADGPDTPSRYDQLATDHARLKRDNAHLTRDLARATAAIQRLALDNHRLQQQLATATGVVALDQARRTRRDRDGES